MKKHLNEITKRLRWYERCMKDVQEGRKPKAMKCTICDSAANMDGGWFFNTEHSVCNTCVLYIGGGCGPGHISRRSAIDSMESEREPKRIRLQKIRKHYLGLIACLERNGFEYK